MLNSRSAGQWWKFVEKDTDTLWISFSAVNTPLGKFTAERLLNHQGANLLLFNDPENGWYQTRIGQIVDIIAETLASKNWASVVVWGYSMGAYAALRFGLPIDYASIYALSPQFIVGYQCSTSTRFTLQKAEDHLDVLRILPRPRIGTVYLFMPCFSLRDGIWVKMARDLWGESVKPYFLKLDHFVQPALYNRDELQLLMRRAALGKRPFVSPDLIAGEREMALAEKAFDALVDWRNGTPIDFAAIDDEGIPNADWSYFKERVRHGGFSDEGDFTHPSSA